MNVRSIESLDPAWNGPRDRIRPAVELLVVVGLLEAELWSLRAIAPAWLNALVYGTIVGTLALSYDRRQKAGAGRSGVKLGIGRSWLEVLLVSSVLSAILIVAAGFLGDSSETFEFVFLDKPPLKLAQWLVGKFFAALGQQLALQYFLGPVCFELTRSRLAGTLLAASLSA